MSKVYTHEYKSLTDLIDRVHLKPHEKNKNHRTSEQFKCDICESSDPEEWYGLPDAKPSDVINAIKYGYPAGKEVIETASTGIEIAPIKSLKRKRIRCAQGDDLDIMRVYSGDLDRAWSNTERIGGGQAYGKNVTIAVDVGGACWRSADSLKWRGAYASALADNYANAGYNVELYAYDVSVDATESGAQVDVIIKVLDSSEPYDLEKLANTISFPGFFRTLIFESILSTPEKVSYGLGRHENTVPAILKDAIIIKNLWTLQEVQKFINTQDIPKGES